MTVELIPVSSILNYESGCTIKRASDEGTGSSPVRLMGKGAELCSRKRVVISTNSEHALSALSKALTKENILENAPKHASASMGALEFASRLAKGRLDRQSYWGAELVQRQCRWLLDVQH